MSLRGATSVLLAAATASLLTGCGTGTQTAVRDVVTGFQEALAAKDGARACGLLSPSARDELRSAAGKPCRRAVTEALAGLPGSFDVAAYGPKAWAHSGSRAVFLAQYAVGGWRITAAGCTRTNHRLYTCTLQGS